MLTDLIENETEKVSGKLICESCGKEFSCGANVGKCWCFAVELKVVSLAVLKDKYKNCLCQDCLESASNEV